MVSQSLSFAGIVNSIPQSLGANLLVAGQDNGKLISFVLMLLMTVILSIVVILITEGQRRIPNYLCRSWSKGRK